MWTREFSSQAYNTTVLYHKKLPLIQTREFDFFRCLSFEDKYYGKTISELHAGNLRLPAKENRYSALFPNQRLSYWSGDPYTAIQESIKHGGSKSRILFQAYDDVSSTFPTTRHSDLVIIDGREHGIGKIIEEFEKTKTITPDNALLIQEIMAHKPDAIAYRSVITGKENFIFFETGFVKLSLRKVRLYLGERPAKNTATILCAVTSDYSPVTEAYGYSFEPVARKAFHKGYLKSTEYQLREACYSSNFCKRQS